VGNPGLTTATSWDRNSLTDEVQTWGDQMIRALVAVGIGALAVGIGAPAASADEFIVCPSGMTGVASEDTSCAFADNVRSALLTQPGTVVSAYSPVTQQSYTMQCAPTVTSIWPGAQRCTGANSYGVSLIVFIRIDPGSSGTTGQSANTPGQPTGSGPSVGVGADSPDLPIVDGPNISCTWVNGYTRSNGTRVSGYMRC